MSNVLDLTALPADCLFTPHGATAPTYATCTADETRVDTLTREFAATDTKGRRFGARVMIGTETRTVTPGCCRLTQWDGMKVTARPHALRGGVSYGALQTTHYFETVEEAHAWADRYFRDAEKRALKNKARAA
jgi:hypothetical protein